MTSKRRLIFPILHKQAPAAKATSGHLFASWTAKLLLVCALGLIAAIWFIWSKVPPEIPLHYSRPWGAKQLVGKSSLMAVAGAGVAVAIIHSALASAITDSNPLLARIFAWSGIFQLLLLGLAILTVYIRVVI